METRHVRVEGRSAHFEIVWYQDGNGLQIALGLDPVLNVFDPPIIGNAFSEQIGFGAAGAYWNATASIDLAGGGLASYTASLEHGFAGGIPMDGQQIAFTRLRFRIDAPVAGTYKVTHPYGVDTFTVATPGKRAINETLDVGLTPLVFTDALGGRVGPFLVAVNPPPPAGFVGDPAVLQTVTGSPFGKNFFQVSGPGGSNLGGPGINVVQTDQFNVSGKIFVMPPAPVANSDTAATAQDKAVTVAVLANDAASAGAMLMPGSVTVVSPPANGTAAVNADGTVTFTPDAGFLGDDSFTYTVSDSLGTVSAAAAANVTVETPPVAGDDAAETSQDTAVVIDVLANDTAAGTLNAGSVAVAKQPANGAAAVMSDGSVKYTPHRGFSGSDSFTYTVADSLGVVSATGTVNVTVQALTAETPPPADTPSGGDNTSPAGAKHASGGCSLIRE